MFYLILAVLSSAGISLVMRLSVDHVRNNMTMLAAGYLSCVLLALLHTGLGGVSLQSGGLPMTLLLAMVAGFLLLAGFVCLQYNTQHNGVVLSGIFSKLGVLVPTVISVVIFAEKPTLLQSAGFLLAIAAIFLMNGGQSGEKAGSRTALLLLLLTNGMADSMSKIYDELGAPSLQELYLLLAFCFAFVLSVAVAIHKKQGLTAGDVAYGLLLGIPNYYSARFLIKALGTIPAVVAYPSYSVATMLAVTALGVCVFREKLTRRQLAALVVILAALVLLN